MKKSLNEMSSLLNLVKHIIALKIINNVIYY